MTNEIVWVALLTGIVLGVSGTRFVQSLWHNYQRRRFNHADWD